MTATRRIRRVLAATDFSLSATSAVDRAIELAGSVGASVTLFHAYHARPPLPGSELAFAAFDIAGMLEAAARTNLERACVELRERFAACPPLEVTLAQGEAAVEIVAEARRGAYDLVVVGTRGRTGLRHLVSGSVAERVIRRSPIPVLTVHEQVHVPAAAGLR